MCKKTLQNITGAKMTSKENYETIFTKAVLKHARLNVKELDVLLCLFEGIEILAL
jgi:hypothetical protein